jgi:carbon-monoxide dehydrogenase small subunit
MYGASWGIDMSTHSIAITVNGFRESLDVPSNLTLLQLLRERLALTGTKNGCAAGECGACTVMMDGEPVNACMVLAVEADGAEVLTVEGLAQEGRLDALQQAFIDEGGVQCGFCTPGMLISARALLDRNPRPSEEDIREALVGNLCRCTGYTRIVRAVQHAAQQGARSEVADRVRPREGQDGR